MRARDAVRALALAGALLPAAAHAGDAPAYLFGLDERAILDTMDHYRGRDGYDARRVLAELSPLRATLEDRYLSLVEEAHR